MADWWENDPTGEESQDWWAADEPAIPAPADVSRETSPNEPPYMQDLRSRFQRDMEQIRDPDFEGMAQRLDDLVRGAADVMSFGTADEIAAAAQAATGVGTLGLPQGLNYEEALAQERARDEASDPAARLGGNILGALALGGAVGAPRTAAQAAGQGAGFGGGYSFGSGEGGFTERAIEGGKGAALGGATALPFYAAANVVAPRVREALQKLRQEGVRPTIGQMSGGAIRRLEEGAKSVPGVGSMIRKAEMRALEDFNRGAINHALRPAGLRLGPKDAVGREGIDKAWDLISKSYDEVLDAIPAVRVDQTFRQQFGNTMNRAYARLGDDAMRDFTNALDDIRSLPSIQSGKVMTGQEMRKIVAELRPKVDKLAKSPTPNTAEAGALLGDIRKSFNDLLKRNASPDQAAQLTGLDRARAGFQPIMTASKADVANKGIFTPNQYLREVRKQSTQGGRMDFQRGRALNQEFGEAAQEIIPSRVPDSGTPERLMPYIMAGGAGYVNPYAGAAVVGGMAPYTRVGQNALAWLAARPSPSQGAQMIAQGLRRSALPAAAGTVVATE